MFSVACRRERGQKEAAAAAKDDFAEAATAYLPHSLRKRPRTASTL
jgi:hypothetical protein